MADRIKLRRGSKSKLDLNVFELGYVTDTNEERLYFNNGKMVPIPNEKDINTIKNEIVEAKNATAQNKKDVLELKEIASKIDDINTKVNENSQKIDTIEHNGVTTSVVERATTDFLNKKISDGTLSNLAIEEDSITWDKFNIYLKANINKMTISTKIEGNLITETFFDQTSKATDISDINNIIEKWYDKEKNILFQRKTTINADGSISESLIKNQ